MYELYPYFTNDGSVGLYSEKDNDIYHSTYGALTEAYEKFILPSNLKNYFEQSNEIKILDICFGIGYNSKSVINFYMDLICNATIHTDNINKELYNGEIDTDNVNCKESLHLYEYDGNFKIYIKAIDTDKILALLSPFVICNKKNLPKDYKLPFDNEKISRMLNKPPKNKIKFFDEINFIFYEKIIEKYPEIFKNKDIIHILHNKKYLQFFKPEICRLFDLDKNCRCSFIPFRTLYTLLHNIYYRHISNRYKKAPKSLTNHNFIFDLKIEDARKELLNDNNMYNLIFLDAFTPVKCPALWSLDFFKLLFTHLDDNGMILTYTNSAAVRNAFIHAGFSVGKIYNPTLNKFTGTIAVKNKSLIKHELSEFDLGLLKTKAGIFYRDENLNALNEAIISLHNKESENSDLMASSRYIKQYRKQTEEI